MEKPKNSLEFDNQKSRPGRLDILSDRSKWPKWLKSVLKGEKYYTNKKELITEEKSTIDKTIDRLNEFEELFYKIRNRDPELYNVNFLERKKILSDLGERSGTSSFMKSLLERADLRLMDGLCDRRLYTVDAMRNLPEYRLSEGHREFLKKQKIDNDRGYMTLADDLLSAPNEGLLKLQKETPQNTEESSFFDITFTGENYHVQKRISHLDITNETSLFIEQIPDNEKILKIYDLITQNPDIEDVVNQRILFGAKIRELPFRAIVGLIKGIVLMQDNSLDRIPIGNCCQRLQYTPGLPIFLEALAYLDREDQGLFIQEIDMGGILGLNKDENWTSDDILNYIKGLLDLLSERDEVIPSKLKRANPINEREYQIAILRRIKKLLKDIASYKISSEEKRALRDTAIFKKEIIVEGALIRSLKNKDRESLNKIKDIEFVVEKGREELFSEEDKDKVKEMITRENIYTPKWAEVLKLKFDKEVLDPNVEWTILRQKGIIVGTRKIKQCEDGTYFVGTFYISPEMQKDFNIGKTLEKVGSQTLPQGFVLRSTVSMDSGVIFRHFRNTPRIITGINQDEYNGIVSEPVFETEIKKDLSEFKTRDLKGDDFSKLFTNASSDNMFARRFSGNLRDEAKNINSYLKGGFVITNLIQEGESVIAVFERRISKD